MFSPRMSPRMRRRPGMLPRGIPGHSDVIQREHTLADNYFLKQVAWARRSFDESTAQERRQRKAKARRQQKVLHLSTTETPVDKNPSAREVIDTVAKLNRASEIELKPIMLPERVSSVAREDTLMTLHSRDTTFYSTSGMSLASLSPLPESRSPLKVRNGDRKCDVYCEVMGWKSCGRCIQKHQRRKTRKYLHTAPPQYSVGERYLVFPQVDQQRQLFYQQEHTKAFRSGASTNLPSPMPPVRSHSLVTNFELHLRQAREKKRKSTFFNQTAEKAPNATESKTKTDASAKDTSSQLSASGVGPVMKGTKKVRLLDARDNEK